MENCRFKELAKHFGQSFDRVLIPDWDRFYSVCYNPETDECVEIECIPFGGLENTVRSYYLQGLSVRVIIGIDQYGNCTSPDMREMEYWQEEDY